MPNVNKKTPEEKTLNKALQNDYPLIPLSKIDDEARKIAVKWGDEYFPGIAMTEKHKLASDIMNYARRYMSKQDEKTGCISCQGGGCPVCSGTGYDLFTNASPSQSQQPESRTGNEQYDETLRLFEKFLEEKPERAKELAAEISKMPSYGPTVEEYLNSFSQQPEITEGEKFYCAEWNRCGHVCEEQCKACSDADKMPEVAISAREFLLGEVKTYPNLSLTGLNRIPSVCYDAIAAAMDKYVKYLKLIESKKG